ncbi:MAG: hypothetical protein ABR874_21250 [Candidatus Sulfotelmatobacter sp.]|jgi:hypothetical protein
MTWPIVTTITVLAHVKIVENARPPGQIAAQVQCFSQLGWRVR